MMQWVFWALNECKYIINRKEIVKKLRMKSGGKKTIVFDITIHTVDITDSTSA